MLLLFVHFHILVYTYVHCTYTDRISRTTTQNNIYYVVLCKTFMKKKNLCIKCNAKKMNWKSILKIGNYFCYLHKVKSNRGAKAKWLSDKRKRFLLIENTKVNRKVILFLSFFFHWVSNYNRKSYTRFVWNIIDCMQSVYNLQKASRVAILIIN